MEVASRMQTRAKAQQQFYAVADKQSQSQPDESATDAESRARRKFQKASNDANDNSYAFRKPTLPASAARIPSASTAPSAPDSRQPAMASRRKASLKENRAPLGPRPFESPSKRVVSDNFSHISRSFLPTSASEPNFDAPGKSNDRNFGFNNRPDNNARPVHGPAASLGSFDFLPQVSFDDFQTSLASYDSVHSPILNDFPSPGSGGGTIFGEKGGSRRRSMAHTHTHTAGPDESSGSDVPPVPSLRGGIAAEQPQFPRNYSNAARPTKTSQDHTGQNQAQMPRTQDVTLSLRTRRQSQAAPQNMSSTAASVATSRQPRKSIGPGLGNLLQGKRTQQDQSNAFSPAPPANISRTPSLNKPSSRRLTVNGLQPPLDPKSHAMKPTAASKLKSIQPLPRHSTLPDLNRPEQNQGPTIRATVKPKTPRAETPTSTDKRRSGRISGLGARTISPTDTARLRRLSMKAPPPPSPAKDTSREAGLTTSRSPSLIPRMPSVTPISSRDTPDYNSRPQLPSLSLSRSSSYQSLRAPSASGSTRIGQSASTSKLPTPKPRNVYSSADRHDGQELVPPVPAIPKAYESPKDQLDTTTPFFSGVKTPIPSNVLGNFDNNDSSLPRPAPKARNENPSTPSVDRTIQRRAPNTTSAAAADNPQALPPVNKKSLQPLRLPPLSLQPLSTPTAVRINSFPPPTANDDQVHMTPPKRYFTKTPSTPMTASKATFYRREDDEPPVPPNLRSTSSHYTFRGATFEEPNDGVPLPSPSNKRGITPFTSGSLPKPGSQFNFKPRLPDEYTLGNHDAEPPATKPMGPRSRATSKSTVKDSASIKTMSSSEDPDPPSSGNSLRRKLSLGWRRTSSKVPPTPTSVDAAQISPPKYDDMPPPKLPASATFADFGATKQPLPDGSRRSLDVTRRKPSVGSTLSTSSTIDPQSNTKPTVASMPTVRQMHSTQQAAQRSSSWSILGSGGNRNAAPKPVPVLPTKTQNKPVSHLDKDDALANEEMRRMSAKRRDVDVAARETDELRKRATRKDRVTPSQAIQSSGGLLNIFEKGEIVDYKEGVYFCGRKDAKKHVGDISSGSSNNFGYDDERGDYNIVMGDHLAYRYEVIDVLGKGSFGQVVRCIDHKHGVLCAIKIIRNKKRFHQQALVEVNILNKLREWDPDGEHATLTITSSFYFRSHLCISSPCLSINLYELIRAHGFTGFSLNIIRRFSRQMLTCLCLLQTKRIIHCDLKPENILLCDPRRADVRVIDFGSSCKADEKVYTYIQSRFYRSPEVILGSEYGLGIDMWSIGCILAELYTGYPIFPGENEQEQLACIMEIFGPPSRDIIEKCTRRKLFFDSSLKPRVTVSSKGRRRRPSSKTLSGALKCDDEAFLDFLVQCLRWDPDKRLRPDQALAHPFITNEPMRRERPRVKVPAPSNGAMTTAGASSNSPVKRIPVAQNATASSSAASTNAPTRSRPLPDTPVTAMKNNAPMSATASPLKAAPAPAPTATSNRRQSLAPSAMQPEKQESTNGGRLPSANLSHAVAGSKRASNGALLAERHQQQMATSAGGYGAAGIGSTGLPRVASGKVDLAGAAARESMGAVSRWR